MSPSEKSSLNTVLPGLSSVLIILCNSRSDIGHDLSNSICDLVYTEYKMVFRDSLIEAIIGKNFQFQRPVSNTNQQSFHSSQSENNSIETFSPSNSNFSKLDSLCYNHVINSLKTSGVKVLESLASQRVAHLPITLHLTEYELQKIIPSALAVLQKKKDEINKTGSEEEGNMFLGGVFDNVDVNILYNRGKSLGDNNISEGDRKRIDANNRNSNLTGDIHLSREEFLSLYLSSSNATDDPKTSKSYAKFLQSLNAKGK